MIKVVSIPHPKSTYPDVIEAACVLLGDKWRFRSQVFLPGRIQGEGSLLLFFDPKPQLKVVSLDEHRKKAQESENTITD